MTRSPAPSVREAAIVLALVVAACGGAQAGTAPLPSAAGARAVPDAPTVEPASAAAASPTASVEVRRGTPPVSAGPVADAGVLFVQGADDGIYRYDGASGAVERVWGASTFDHEVGNGVYVVGRHGGAALLRWDGATEAVPCGTGYADVAPTGACASAGTDGVSVRLAGEQRARVVLPPDWQGGSPSWSPDGRRLLLVRTIEPRAVPGMDPGLAALWLMEADGRVHEVYRPTGRGSLAGPRWSSDGTKALVRQYETTSASFAADGVGVTTVLVDLVSRASRSLGTTRSETWDPSGRLAFVRGGSRLTWSNKQLVVLESTGAEAVRAGADDTQVALAPAWGPSGRLAWVSGPSRPGDYNGDGYVDGRGAGRRVAVVEQAGLRREISCTEGRVVEGVRWSVDATRLLLLCRKVGRDPTPLEAWLYRLADGTSVPLLRDLVGPNLEAGFGFYGAQPAITAISSWSLGAP